LHRIEDCEREGSPVSPPERPAAVRMKVSAHERVDEAIPASPTVRAEAPSSEWVDVRPTVLLPALASESTFQ